MNGSNHDSFGYDGDWDSSGGELAWNEHDWKQYLKRIQREEARFLRAYDRTERSLEHLDEVARSLGWDREDWSPAQATEGSETPGFETDDDASADADDLDPYTLHRHPVYVVTHSLFDRLQSGWQDFVGQIGTSGALADPTLSQIPGSLRRAEVDALMALMALDMGDFNLAVCHLKLAMSWLNESMGLLPDPVASPLHAHFTHEARSSLFDLREVWLRVLRECREEARRESDSDD